MEKYPEGLPSHFFREKKKKDKKKKKKKYQLTDKEKKMLSIGNPKKRNSQSSNLSILGKKPRKSIDDMSNGDLTSFNSGDSFNNKGGSDSFALSTDKSGL